MGEQGKATNQLGQLFVDIGLGGVGKTLKGLNTVSASFLMVKTAATQLAKPFVEFGKEAANNAVQIGKMSSMFSFTMTEYQKLIRYFKDHKVSESLVGDLTSLSDLLTKFQKRLASPSYMQQYAANQLGIGNLLEYSGTMEDVIKLVERVQEGVKGMDQESARTWLQELGMQAEWLWAFQQGDFRIRDAKSIPDSEVQSMIDLEMEWQKTVEDLKTIIREFVSKGAPLIKEIIRKLEPVVDKLYASIVSGEVPTTIDEAKTLVKKNVAKKGVEILSQNPLAGTALGPIFALTQGIQKRAFQQLNENNKVQTVNGISGNGNIALPPPPTTSSKGSTNINVYNDNKITTDKPFEVAEELNDISADSILESARRNSYEKSNLPGY